MMNIANSDLTLSELDNNKWYYIKNDGEIVGIKIDDEWINIKFVEDDYSLRFKYNKETFDEMNQYYFKEDYDQELNKDIDTLEHVADMSQVAFNMSVDVDYKPRFIEKLL